MTADADPEALRAEQLETWDRAAAGWAARRESVQAFATPVSEWMLDAIAPEPGQRVLELAAGVGDTGLMAAESVKPGGTVISSDGTQGMLAAAQERARELGVDNVEFARLEVEWIDLPTASVDAVLCRWGLMFVVDLPAALTEIRRVVRPGGRVAVAAWDGPEANPWATIPSRALAEREHVARSASTALGQFSLAAPGRLAELLAGAGFTEVRVEPLDLDSAYESLEEFVEETRDLSRTFGHVLDRLDERERGAIVARIAELAAPFRTESGGLRFPARTLVASASA